MTNFALIVYGVLSFLSFFGGLLFLIVCARCAFTKRGREELNTFVWILDNFDPPLLRSWLDYLRKQNR